LKDLGIDGRMILNYLKEMIWNDMKCIVEVQDMEK